jgi:hypothetical protein
MPRDARSIQPPIAIAGRMTMSLIAVARFMRAARLSSPAMMAAKR